MAALHPIVHGATRWLCFVKWQIRQVLQSHNPNCAIPQKGFTGFASTTNDSRSSPTLKEEKWDDRNYRWFPLSNSQICRPFKLSEWTCKNVILNKRFGRNQVENIKRSVINDLALRADWEKTKIPWNTPIIPKRPILRCCFSAKDATHTSGINAAFHLSCKPVGCSSTVWRSVKHCAPAWPSWWTVVSSVWGASSIWRAGKEPSVLFFFFTAKCVRPRVEYKKKQSLKLLEMRWKKSHSPTELFCYLYCIYK